MARKKGKMEVELQQVDQEEINPNFSLGDRVFHNQALVGKIFKFLKPKDLLLARGITKSCFEEGKKALERNFERKLENPLSLEEFKSAYIRTTPKKSYLGTMFTSVKDFDDFLSVDWQGNPFPNRTVYFLPFRGETGNLHLDGWSPRTRDFCDERGCKCTVDWDVPQMYEKIMQIVNKYGREIWSCAIEFPIKGHATQSLELKIFAHIIFKMPHLRYLTIYAHEPLAIGNNQKIDWRKFPFIEGLLGLSVFKAGVDDTYFEFVRNKLGKVGYTECLRYIHLPFFPPNDKRFRPARLLKAFPDLTVLAFPELFIRRDWKFKCNVNSNSSTKPKIKQRYQWTAGPFVGNLLSNLNWQMDKNHYGLGKPQQRRIEKPAEGIHYIEGRYLMDRPEVEPGGRGYGDGILYELNIPLNS